MDQMCDGGGRMPLCDVRELMHAVGYACAAHGQQLRKTGELYATHPIEVLRTVMLLVEPEDNKATLIAAALHDVVEDTHVSLQQIRTDFGDQVADIVSELTNDKTMSLHDRKQQVIARAKTFSRSARIIKLADRHHNLLTCERMPVEFLERYCRESRGLLMNLAVVGVNKAFDTLLQQCYEKLTVLEALVLEHLRKPKS